MPAVSPALEPRVLSAVQMRRDIRHRDTQRLRYLRRQRPRMISEVPSDVILGDPLPPRRPHTRPPRQRGLRREQPPALGHQRLFLFIQAGQLLVDLADHTPRSHSPRVPWAAHAHPPLLLLVVWVVFIII